MHHWVPLVFVTSLAYQDTSAAAQYHPETLQPFYQDPSPAHPPTFNSPPERSNLVYTFAEVNTPYYYYQYYAPVYKNPLGQSSPFETSSPESPFRNEVTPYDYRGPTPVPNLFYPASPKVHLEAPTFPRNDCTPPYCDQRKNYNHPSYIPAQESPFVTSRPDFRSPPYAPSFTNYGDPSRRRIPFRPPMKPIIPSNLATDSPNIIRENTKEQPKAESFGKDRIYGSTNNPYPSFSPTADTPYETSRPIFVPGSLATPSSSIIKDEVRRGVLFQPDASQVKSPLGMSSTSSPYPTSPSFIDASETYPPPPLEVGTDNEEVPAEVDLISSINSNSLSSSRSATIRSIVLSTELVVNDADGLDSDRSLFTQNLPVSPSHTNSSITTKIHTQKIPQKVHPTEVVKKEFYKNPNILFEAPGHEIPN